MPEEPAGKQNDDIKVTVEDPVEDAPVKKPKIKIPIDNTKRDLSFLQKKISELEISVSEISESIEKIDLSKINGMEQKVSDIEDLIMVENAAVLELKKMLEGQAAGQDAKPNEEITNRLNALEEKISNVPRAQTDTTQIDELKSSVENISSRVSDIKHGIDTSSFDSRFQEIENGVNQKISDMDSKISYALGVNKIVEEFRSDMDMKRKSLETMANSIEEKLRMPLSERAVEELEKIRNDWIMNTARLDSIETIVQTFSKSVEYLKPAVKKLETLEKMVNLHQELEDKMREFEQVEQSIENSVRRNEDTELKIQREANKLKDTNRDLQDLREDVADMKGYFNSMIDSMKDRLGDLEEHSDSEGDSLDESYNKLNEIQDKIATIESDMSVFQGSLMSFENKMSEVGFSDVTGRLDSLSDEVYSMKSMEPEPTDKTNELVNTINKLEDRINLLESNSMDGQMTQLLERLIFLESRLAALESMGGTRGYSAIIVE